MVCYKVCQHDACRYKSPNTLSMCKLVKQKLLKILEYRHQPHTHTYTYIHALIHMHMHMHM